MFRKYLLNLANKAVRYNEENILDLLKNDSNAHLLDLGCDDGSWTIRLAGKIGTNDIYGVDIVSKRLKLASSKGIKTFCVDLNNKLPFEDNFFDIIHANQAIEHLNDTDKFITEIYRILKVGGELLFLQRIWLHGIIFLLYYSDGNLLVQPILVAKASEIH